MITKRRVALFPASVRTLPIARYINSYSSQDCVTALLAMPGSSLVGADACTADNREPTGIIVSDNVESTKYVWDVLYVAETVAEGSDIRSLNIETMVAALECGKSVVCNAALPQDELERLSHLAETSGCAFEYISRETPELSYSSKKLFRPASFVIFVGGIVSEANSFEIFLMLCGELSKKLRVSGFSSNVNSTLCGAMSIANIICSRELAETEKVYAINKIVENSCDYSTPDAIIVHIDEPMLEYSENIPNGFGIIAYMISKALLPDYFICGVPYKYGNSAYIQLLSEGISNKLDYGIDYVHVSNVEADLTASSTGVFSPVYSSFRAVDDQIVRFCVDSEIPVANLMMKPAIDGLSSELVEKITANREIMLLF